MKRLLAVLLCLAMCLSLIPAAAAEDIEIIETDPEEEFEDIGGDGLIAVIDPERPGEEFTAPSDELMAAKPTITTQPASVKAYVGTTAKFTVKADGATAYQWYYRTSSSGTWSKSSTTGATTATLSVKAETKRSGYQYRCKLTNSAGYVYTSAATLTVSEKPVITTQPASKTVSAGSTAKFTVKADGAESYQWYYRKTADASWAKTSMTGATTATLSVSATTARNGYQYKCAVKNAKGTTYSSVATMTVTAAKPTISTQPLSYTAGTGATIYFKIKASGADSYQWQYRTSSSGSWKTSTLTGNKTATLTVKATEARSGYQYRCKAINASGTSYSKAATLTVYPDRCGEKTTWKLDSAGLMTIAGSGPMDNFDYNSAPWFQYWDEVNQCSLYESIRRVSFGSSVTRVGDLAFGYCDKLTNVTFKNGLVAIGYRAFVDCTSLQNFTLPDSLSEIGASAFGSCESLTSVKIPAGVVSIGGTCFVSCYALTDITVASGNQHYCSKNGVLFNKDKTVLMQHPCAKPGFYTIPAGVETIAWGAFASCEGLTGVTIPDSVTTIEQFAFSNCIGLTEVTIPNSVTTIGMAAFQATGLSSVKIPAAVTEIGDYPFGYCDSLTSITVDSANPNYSAKNGVLFNKNKTTLVQFPAGRTGSYTIPGSVTELAARCFAGAALSAVTIPNSVTKMGSYVFDTCGSLTSMTIPDSVTELGEGIFYSCNSLTSVKFGAGITELPYDVCNSCSALTSVTIPSNVTKIEDWAFGYCTALKSITIPNSVTSIGYCSFDNCNVLSSVKLGTGLKTLGEWAFADCWALKSITIPDGVTEIKYGAFMKCEALGSVTLGTGLQKIVECAFADCNKLTDVYYKGSETQWNAIEITDYGNESLLYASMHYNA